MPKNLVIVESPAKAKTIEKFLGKDYVVKSSFGHIRDLPKKGLNIDIEKGFAPKYEISADKKKVVSELKKAAKGSEVWLASDEDREGEAIAWHLTHALGLDPAKTKRIVFHQAGHRGRHQTAAHRKHQAGRSSAGQACPGPPSGIRIIANLMEKSPYGLKRRPSAIGRRTPDRGT
jgi:DNA topoisomerase IA